MNPTALRSRLSRLPSEDPPGIGHNKGPALEPGHGFRKVAWGKARAALLPRLPLEVLKRRVKRAQELGLAYPAYASILAGTGRDVVAFLFTSHALGLRLARAVEVPERDAARLREITGARRLLLGPEREDASRLAEALGAERRIVFDLAEPAPALEAPLPEGRAAVQALLTPLKLPADGVVMVGDRAAERDWAEAARLGRFLSRQAYFEPS
ncbi:MAG: hypothetical protein AAFU61_12660 [Pseudomonadota bacterium]